MGLFGRSNRKIKNAAAMVLEQEPTTVNVDARSDSTGPIVVTFVCAVVGLFLLWHIGVFILDRAGFDDPEAALAVMIVGLLALLALVGVAALAGRLIFSGPLQAYYDYKTGLAQLAAETARQNRLTAQAPMGHRANSEDQRFIKLIEAVCFEAYGHIAKHGQYNGKDPRPWSRRQAEAVVLAGEQEPVGSKLGGQVRGWLSQRGVIKNNQLNLDRYPSFGHVQHLLLTEFDLPIVYDGRGDLPALSDGNYSIIEQKR